MYEMSYSVPHVKSIYCVVFQNFLQPVTYSAFMSDL